MSDRFDEMASDIMAEAESVRLAPEPQRVRTESLIAAALRSVAAPPPALTEERIAEMADALAERLRRLPEHLRASEIDATLRHVAAATQAANVAEAVRRSEELVVMLEEALRFYAEPANHRQRDLYSHPGQDFPYAREDSPVMKDAGGRARRALAKEPSR